jgi:hypothetical protein
MSLLRNEHSVTIGDTKVTVVGRTGPIAATWSLLLDGHPVAEQRFICGDPTLSTKLLDGSALDVDVHQGALGPTRVRIRHAGVPISESAGFVA